MRCDITNQNIPQPFRDKRRRDLSNFFLSSSAASGNFHGDMQKSVMTEMQIGRTNKSDANAVSGR